MGCWSDFATPANGLCDDVAAVVSRIFKRPSKTLKPLRASFLYYITLCFIHLTENDFSKGDLVSSVQRDSYPKNQHLRAYHQKIDNNLGE